MDLKFVRRWTRRLKSAATALLMVAALSVTAQGASVTLQHNDSLAKDVFVYEFLSTDNMDNFQFGKVNFGTILAITNTGTQSNHNIKTLIQFDLSELGLFYPGQIQTAELKLRVVASKSVNFPVVDPSAAFPVTLDVESLAESWEETKVLWKPVFATVGGVLDSVVVAGINQTLSLDVTSAAKGWVSAPNSNLGLLLSQREEVRDDNFKAVGVVMASSNFGSNLPALVIELAAELPGDANFDGFVDGGDYTIWADNYGGDPRVFAQGDFTHDGVVDGADYTIWADNYSPGSSLATASAVPEPATVALLASAAPAILLTLLSRRRRFG